MPRTAVPLSSSFPSCCGGEQGDPGGGWIAGVPDSLELPTPERRTVRVAASPSVDLARLQPAVERELADGAAEPRRRGRSGCTSIVCAAVCRRICSERATAGPKKKRAVVALHRQVDRRRLHR